MSSFHIRRMINDRHETRFWKDHWIPNFSVLEERYSYFIPMGQIEYFVCSYVIDRDWNWNMLATRVPKSILQFGCKVEGTYWRK
jgi:hypothetical protein